MPKDNRTVYEVVADALRLAMHECEARDPIDSPEGSGVYRAAQLVRDELRDNRMPFFRPTAFFRRCREKPKPKRMPHLFANRYVDKSRPYNNVVWFYYTRRDYNTGMPTYTVYNRPEQNYPKTDRKVYWLDGVQHELRWLK